MALTTATAFRQVHAVLWPHICRVGAGHCRSRCQLVVDGMSLVALERARTIIVTLTPLGAQFTTKVPDADFFAGRSQPPRAVEILEERSQDRGWLVFAVRYTLSSAPRRRVGVSGG